MSVRNAGHAARGAILKLAVGVLALLVVLACDDVTGGPAPTPTPPPGMFSTLPTTEPPIVGDQTTLEITWVDTPTPNPTATPTPNPATPTPIPLRRRLPETLTYTAQSGQATDAQPDAIHCRRPTRRPRRRPTRRPGADAQPDGRFGGGRRPTRRPMESPCRRPTRRAHADAQPDGSQCRPTPNPTAL